MDKFLKDFYETHFRVKDSSVALKDEYAERINKISEAEDNIRKAKASDSDLANLFDDYTDTIYDLIELYYFSDFCYQFLTGLQLGIEISTHKTNIPPEIS